jgi:hypothetical protein
MSVLMGMRAFSSSQLLALLESRMRAVPLFRNIRAVRYCRQSLRDLVPLLPLILSGRKKKPNRMRTTLLSQTYAQVRQLDNDNLIPALLA